MKDKDLLEIEENNKKDINEKQENYMALGMCFGVMAGSIGMAILSAFGQIAWGGLSVGVGLCGGMIIGMIIPKNK